MLINENFVHSCCLYIFGINLIFFFVLFQTRRIDQVINLDADEVLPDDNDDDEDDDEIGYKRKKASREGNNEGEKDGDDEKDNENDDDEDDDEDQDDDEDDTEALMRELNRIKQERAAEAQRLEAEKKTREEKIRVENILKGNPLLNSSKSSSGGAPSGDIEFKVKRRWDDDVVFKNCAKLDESKKKGFVNDTLRSEFHKKFMERYIK
jgi:hypothetical protein